MSRQLPIDALESRRLFHNVTLLTDGTLIVEGEATANHFIFDQTKTRISLQSFDGGVAETPNSFFRTAVKQILVYGGNSPDTIELGDVSAPISVDAAKGNDTITGGAGRDTLKGDAGRDVLKGGDGDDLIDGGSGNDSLEGGSGLDILDYRDRTSPVHVELGTDHNGDMALNEADFASVNFEIVRGGHADDTLTTTSARNVTLLGGDGDDTLVGGNGNDAIVGGPGRDSMAGNGGVDQFYAQDGAIDTVVGGAGDDRIHDQDKNDVLHGIIG